MNLSSSAPPPSPARPVLPLILVGLGFVLQGASAVGYLMARNAQRIEQDQRDQHWEQVQHEAAQTFPHMLPGEEKPAPAPLPWVPQVLLLAAAGSASVAAGAVWWSRIMRARKAA